MNSLENNMNPDFEKHNFSVTAKMKQVPSGYLRSSNQCKFEYEAVISARFDKQD